YWYNTTVTATAMPAYGWTFSGWSGAASGTSTSVGITMNADKTVTATFVLAPQSGPNFVVTTNDDHDDGLAGVLDCSLREAINAANANGDSNTITFAAGVSGEIALKLGQLPIIRDVAIVGPGSTSLALN